MKPGMETLLLIELSRNFSFWRTKGSTNSAEKKQNAEHFAGLVS
jgi:hypothetical protein